MRYSYPADIFKFLESIWVNPSHNLAEDLKSVQLSLFHGKNNSRGFIEFKHKDLPIFATIFLAKKPQNVLFKTLC
jgi:hypothetical protein